MALSDLKRNLARLSGISVHQMSKKNLREFIVTLFRALNSATGGEEVSEGIAVTLADNTGVQDGKADATEHVRVRIGGKLYALPLEPLEEPEVPEEPVE